MNPQQPQPQQAQDPSQFGEYSDWASREMANGVSADTLHQTLQAQGINPQSAPQQQSQGGGNFLESLLPTAGSVLGSIAGGLIPGLGEIGVGEAGGGAAGEAIGKGLENILEGKNVTQDLGTSAVEGGIGGLTGGIASKVAGAVLPKASNLLEQGATSLVKGQAPALSTETSQYLTNAGVNNLSQMRQIAPIVTGSEGSLSTGVKGILQEAGDQGTTMDLSSLGRSGQNMSSDLVNQHSINSGLGQNTSQSNNVQDFVQNTLQKYNPDAITTTPGKGGTQVTGFDNGVLNKQAPIDVLGMTQDFDSRAAEWMKSRSPDIQAQGLALKNLSNDVKSNLYGDSTSIGQMGVPTEVKQQMIDDLSPLQKINPAYYQTKVEEINNASNIAELRSAQRPDVETSLALNAQDLAANRGTGNTLRDIIPGGAAAGGLAVGGPIGAIGGFALGKALESPAAGAVGANVLSKLSDVVGSKTAGNLVGTLARVGAAGAANLPSMGATPAAGEGTTTNQGVNPLQQPGGEAMQGQNPYGMLTNALIAQDILAPSQYGGTAGSTLTSLIPTLQKNTAAQTALSGLEPTFQQAGGAQGLGGIGSVLSSLIPGTAANVYQQRQKAAAAQLGAALGISPDQAQAYLPQLLQSQTSAGQNFNVLGGLSGGLPAF